MIRSESEATARFEAALDRLLLYIETGRRDEALCWLEKNMNTRFGPYPVDTRMVCTSGEFVRCCFPASATACLAQDPIVCIFTGFDTQPTEGMRNAAAARGLCFCRENLSICAAKANVWVLHAPQRDRTIEWTQGEWMHLVRFYAHRRHQHAYNAMTSLICYPSSLTEDGVACAALCDAAAECPFCALVRHPIMDHLVEFTVRMRPSISLVRWPMQDLLPDWVIDATLRWSPLRAWWVRQSVNAKRSASVKNT